MKKLILTFAIVLFSIPAFAGCFKINLGFLEITLGNKDKTETIETIDEETLQPDSETVTTKVPCAKDRWKWFWED